MLTIVVQVWFCIHSEIIPFMLSMQYVNPNNPFSSLVPLNLRGSQWKLLLMPHIFSECLTLPQGDDLDQVIVGTGPYAHRQLFEKAYKVGGLIGR